MRIDLGGGADGARGKGAEEPAAWGALRVAIDPRAEARRLRA